MDYEGESEEEEEGEEELEGEDAELEEEEEEEDEEDEKEYNVEYIEVPIQSVLCFSFGLSRPPLSNKICSPPQHSTIHFSPSSSSPNRTSRRATTRVRAVTWRINPSVAPCPAADPSAPRAA